MWQAAGLQGSRHLPHATCHLPQVIDAMNAPSITAHLFGSLCLYQNNQEIALPETHNARLLLAYFLLHPTQTFPRAVLAGLFWPEEDEARARRKLTQAIWRIQQVLPEFFYKTKTAVSVSPHIQLQVDVHEFQTLIQPYLHREQPHSSNHAQAIAQLRQALSLVRGELLEGYYADWVLLERERLRDKQIQVIEKLINLEKFTGQYEQALEHARHLAQMDPIRETVHQEIMRLYIALGQHEAALQQFDICCHILDSELSISPTNETKLLAFSAANKAGLQTSAFVPDGTPVKSALALDASGLLPLIGRSAEKALLLDKVMAVFESLGGVGYVIGPAGIGKSRLLREVAEMAEWRGVQISWGYTQNLAGERPYSAITQAVSTLLSPLRIHQLHAILPTLWLTAAAPLLPQITQTLPDLQPLPPLPPDQELVRQQEAFARLLIALSQISPQLIILENLHWADKHTIDALAYIARRLKESQLLILCSFRQEEAQANPDIWNGLQEIALSGLRARIELSPLRLKEVGDFIKEGLGLTEDAPRFARRLYQQCGGNPFHILETLRSLHENGLLYQDEARVWHTPFDDSTEDYAELPIPEASEEVVRRRLSLLPPDASQTLLTAALIGQQVSFKVLETAVPLTTTALFSALNLLVQRHFLQETPDGYQFSHDLIQHTLLAQATREETLPLHGRIAQALETHQPNQPEPLAHHYRLAGQTEKAIHYGLLAIQAAKDTYATEAALHLVNQTLALNPPANVRYQLLAHRAEIHSILGNTQTAQQDLQQMAQLAATPAQQIETALKQAHWFQEQSQFEAAVQHAQQAKEIALTNSNYPALVKAELALSDTIYSQTGDIQKASIHLHNALKHVDVVDTQTATDIYLLQARLLKGGSNYQEAIAIFQKVLAKSSHQNQLAAQEYVHWQLGTIYMEMGKAAEANTHFEQALTLAQKMGYRYREAAIYVNWGNALWMQGQLAKTLNHYDKAIRIFREMGHRRGEAQLLANLASMRCGLLGEYKEALAEVQQAMAYYGESGDEIGIGQALSIFGQIAMGQGKWDVARRYLEESVPVLEKVGEKFILSQVYRSLAELAAAEDKPERGWEPLAKAEALCRETGMAVVLPTLVGVKGLLLLKDGRFREALEATTEAMSLQGSGSDHGYLVPYWHSLALQANRQRVEAETAAAEAYNLLLSYLQSLPPEKQAYSLTHVPDHKAIVEAWQNCQNRHIVTVELPSIDDSKETVTVTWHASLPEDGRIPQKKARRQHQLRRLLEQAAAQNAAPTHQHLAKALNVSIGTIKRDMAELRQTQTT
jgi:predicted ATPase/DNA-binding SARP family transcriptional activator